MAGTAYHRYVVYKDCETLMFDFRRSLLDGVTLLS